MVSIQNISFLLTLVLMHEAGMAQDNHVAAGCEQESVKKVCFDTFRKPVKFSSTVTLVPERANISIKPSTAKLTAPEGMVLVPEGFTTIGSTSLWQEDATFKVQVKAFFMDEHPVTVAQFRLFVLATGYVTEAEKFGNSGFIDTSSGNQWILKKGANWKYPHGADYPAALDDHPVTQVSWNDAKAYCTWADKRLPNEFEFEYAAKNASNIVSLYPWGDDLVVDGVYKANVWQGTFPHFNEVKDGFKFTSPIGYFGKNELGLSDMSGNVWQWCENDKFSYEALLTAASQKQFYHPKTAEKVMRGGSFLCEPSWCHGYRVTGRSGSSPETALMHVGFRCVKDVD